MTDPTDRERRAEINRLGTLWNDGWTRPMADEYHRALNDIPPREIAWGISEAVKTRTVRPKPAQLRELIETTRAAVYDQRRREARAAELGEGQGCPTCRHHDVQGDWIDGGNDMTWCATHNIAWQGILPNAGADPGPDVEYSEWAATVADGNYPDDVKDFIARHTRWVAARPGKPQRLEPVYDLPPILQRVIGEGRNAA